MRELFPGSRGEETGAAQGAVMQVNQSVKREKDGAPSSTASAEIGCACHVPVFEACFRGGVFDGRGVREPEDRRRDLPS